MMTNGDVQYSPFAQPGLVENGVSDMEASRADDNWFLP